MRLSTGSNDMKPINSADWRIALVVGGPPKVDEPAQATLRTLVEQNPRDLGLAYSGWSCLELAKCLLRRGHPLVSDETIRRHLRQLDYRIIRPVLSIASPDPAF